MRGEDSIVHLRAAIPGMMVEHVPGHGIAIVRADDLVVLSEMEKQEGQRRDIEEFKFPTNEEMLAAIRKNQSGSKVPASR